MEKINMKLEVYKQETFNKLNEFFRKKVQLDEELKENEAQLQFHRGILFAFDKAQQAIQDIQKGEQIEAMRAKKAELSAAPLSAVPSGDGDKEEAKIPEVKSA